MRASKSRSRNRSNRQRSLGNVVNRVFDSSGPEGKVRGTPQQIIDKYLALARDSQLSSDRVAEQSFLQHAEHYTRMLAEAQREMAERQQQAQQRGDGDDGRSRDTRRNPGRDRAQEDRAQDGSQDSDQRSKSDDTAQDTRARDAATKDAATKDDKGQSVTDAGGDSEAAAVADEAFPPARDVKSDAAAAAEKPAPKPRARRASTPRATTTRTRTRKAPVAAEVTEDEPASSEG